MENFYIAFPRFFSKDLQSADAYDTMNDVALKAKIREVAPRDGGNFRGANVKFTKLTTRSLYN